MAHVDKLKISLMNTPYHSNRDENHPMEQAKKLGFTKFMIKDGEWRVFDKGWKKLSEVIK